MPILQALAIIVAVYGGLFLMCYGVPYLEDKWGISVNPHEMETASAVAKVDASSHRLNGDTDAVSAAGNVIPLCRPDPLADAA